MCLIEGRWRRQECFSLTPWANLAAASSPAAIEGSRPHISQMTSAMNDSCSMVGMRTINSRVALDNRIWPVRAVFSFYKRAFHT